MKIEPSVALFMEFSEKRALAMDNADQVMVRNNKQGQVVNTVVAESFRGCLL